tara:strand:- start:464 stop:739 length:276 start_codon:yes stop_codon:yes gene_type:complete
MTDKQPTINYGPAKGTNEYGLFELRTERDKLLVESDWTQSPDSPLTDEKKKEWATYRQSLRDMTKTYSTVPLDKKGYMDWEKVTWPTAPKG